MADVTEMMWVGKMVDVTVFPRVYLTVDQKVSSMVAMKAWRRGCEMVEFLVDTMAKLKAESMEVQ